MSFWLANGTLTLGPPLLAYLSSRGDRLVEAASALLPRSSGKSSSYAVFASLAAVPLFLTWLAQASQPARVTASVFASLAAAVGAQLVFGRAGTALAATLLGAVWLGVDRYGIAYDLLSLSAAVCAGALLCVILGKGMRLLFLVILSVVDLAVVGFALSTAALFPAAFSDSFPAAATPPVFSGVALGGYFLGGIDIACALLVGREIRDAKRIAPILVIYLTAQVGMAAVGVGASAVVPAALAPAAAVIGARAIARRSRHTLLQAN